MESRLVRPGFTLLVALALALACATAEADGLWGLARGDEGRDGLAELSAIAHRALEEKQPAAASRAALEAIRVAPRSGEAHVLLGHARALAGDHESACDAYAHALELDARALDRVRDASWAAIAAAHAERWLLAERALRALTEGLPRVPARTIAFTKLGDVLQALGRVDESITAYHHSLLDARGFYAPACLGLARALERSDRATDALGWARRAVRLASADELLSASLGPEAERRARAALLARAEEADEGR